MEGVAKKPRWPWVTLLALQSLQVLSLVPWLLMAATSVMAFDAPGSEKMWQPWAFVIAIWSYPLWLLLAAGGSWLLYAFFHRPTAAVILAAVFTLPMLVLPLLALALCQG
jgi:hypothetical protein